MAVVPNVTKHSRSSDESIVTPVSRQKTGPGVWAFGPLPPPVTGLTLMTERVISSLQQNGPVKLCNWSHGCQKMSVRARARRVRRTLQCLLNLSVAGKARGRSLYLVANSRSGLVLTAAFVFVAKKLGYRIYLHHHAYTYIDQYDRRMAWIDRALEVCGTHIVHCQQMIDDFRRQYPTAKRFETVFPSIVSIDVEQPRSSARKPFVLGMLSNLTVAKGVRIAIETFEELDRKGFEVRLKLAGPVGDSEAQVFIDSAVKRNPEKVQYVGPVYGAAKAEYLACIDALLFPTQYKDESWGIVINEALAAGLPVITFDRGCTRTVVGPQAGLIVPREASYVAAAANQVAHWITDGGAYRIASRAAINQANYLHRQGNLQLEEFAQRVFAPLHKQVAETRHDHV